MNENVIVVAGKTGCGPCEAAKAKLVRLGIPYMFVDMLAEMMAPTAIWRETDLAGAVAQYEMHDRNVLPWLRIDGEWLTYPESMLALRKRLAATEAAKVEAVAV
jgi:hypothetical protein